MKDLNGLVGCGWVWCRKLDGDVATSHSPIIQASVLHNVYWVPDNWLLSWNVYTCRPTTRGIWKNVHIAASILIRGPLICISFLWDVEESRLWIWIWWNDKTSNKHGESHFTAGGLDLQSLQIIHVSHLQNWTFLFLINHLIFVLFLTYKVLTLFSLIFSCHCYSFF